MIKLYISGPMTGKPDDNLPAFHAAEKQLIAAGFKVINPAHNPPGLSRAQYMRLDYQHVLRADGIALLDGHMYSPGAGSEKRAGFDLNLPIAPVDWWVVLGKHHQAACHALRSYEHGNAAPDLAQDVADRLGSIDHALRGLHLSAMKGGAL